MSRIPITDEVMQKLLRLRRETGVSSRRLLRGQDDKPTGLNSSIIDQWLAGNVKSAKPDHIAFVLSAWKKVDPVLEITDQIRGRINDEFDRTNLQVTAFLKAVPTGQYLTADKISKIRNGGYKEIQKSHLDMLIADLAKYPDRRL